MAVTAHDYLQYCQDSIEQIESEVHYRAIVSRAYYAMYHSAIELLDNTPPNYRGMGVHASLISYLRSPDIATLKSMIVVH